MFKPPESCVAVRNSFPQNRSLGLGLKNGPALNITQH